MLVDKLIICSHHKSGAAISYKIFYNIAQQFGMNFWKKFYEPDLHNPRDSHASWDICFHPHGRVQEMLNVHRFKAWRMVRHPMALIYSAALFHQKCREPWLDIPLEKFDQNSFFVFSDGQLYNIIKDPEVALGHKQSLLHHTYTPDAAYLHRPFRSDYEFKGKTYRELLLNAERMEEKLLFEMHAYSQGVLQDMVQFPKDNRFHTVHMEDVSFDSAMKTLQHVFEDFGFTGDDLAQCLRIASGHCLWKVTKQQFGEHATTGVSEDWRRYFSGEVLQEFRRLFGYAETALGYDPFD